MTDLVKEALGIFYDNENFKLKKRPESFNSTKTDSFATNSSEQKFLGDESLQARSEKC